MALGLSILIFKIGVFLSSELLKGLEVVNEPGPVGFSGDPILLHLVKASGMRTWLW